MRSGARDGRGKQPQRRRPWAPTAGVSPPSPPARPRRGALGRQRLRVAVDSHGERCRRAAVGSHGERRCHTTCPSATSIGARRCHLRPPLFHTTVGCRRVFLPPAPLLPWDEVHARVRPPAAATPTGTAGGGMAHAHGEGGGGEGTRAMVGVAGVHTLAVLRVFAAVAAPGWYADAGCRPARPRRRRGSVGDGNRDKAHAPLHRAPPSPPRRGRPSLPPPPLLLAPLPPIPPHAPPPSVQQPQQMGEEQDKKRKTREGGREERGRHRAPRQGHW